MRRLSGHRFLNRGLLFFVASILMPSLGHCSGHSEGVSPSSAVIISIGGFPITDSMVLSWIVSACVILLIRFMLRGGVRLIPATGQAIIESIVGGIGGIVSSIVGEKAAKIVPSFVLSYFFFVFLQNLGGLFPGIGSIGVYTGEEFRPFFRPGNSDLNTTLALALVAFFAWLFYCIKCAGVRGLVFEIFGNKAERKEISSFMYAGLFVLFIAVGLVECISILCRIVSLSFRLFGNTFGGENLLHNMYAFPARLKDIPLVNYLSYFIPLPFYFLEFLVAIIQAFVFTLLVSVYIGLVCNTDEHEHDQTLGEQI